MLFALSAAVSIKTQYIEKRGNVYQFVMRVPADLIERFGRERIRESLKTSDAKEAIGKANALAKKYLVQFKALRGNVELTPVEISQAAAELVSRYDNAEDFINFHIDPKRERHAGADEEIYIGAAPEEYLNAVELEAGNASGKVNMLFGYQPHWNSTGLRTRSSMTSRLLPR